MKLRLMMSAALALALAGCAEKAPVEQTSPAAGSAELEQVVQTAPAPQSVGVAAARSEVKSGDPVTVQGRVKDFVDGAAVFTIVDGAIPSCADNPDDGCTTPWDYCCEPADKMAQNTATVKVVGSDKNPLPGTVKGVRSIDHLTTVTVEGTAERDEKGNLTVNASKVYVNAGK